jgi:hypothetical protein
MTNTTPTPAQLLTRAADLLDERGWHQGDYVGNDGCVCMLGAVRVAAIDAEGAEVTIQDLDTKEMDELVSERTARMVEIAESTLTKLVNAETQVFDPAVWNDQKGRTKEEVQAMLRRAAEAGAS